MEQNQRTDYILCECPLDNLTGFVGDLSVHYPLNLLKAPRLCLTMIQAEDSVEYQPFYLGEALTTTCEVAINKTVGYGICLGDEPERAYCLAVLDAVMALNDAQAPAIDRFLAEQLRLIQHREETELSHIMRTKVDFKLMEQA
ncbi:phosphonate C-P lyase system protein PhnG [Fibrisoma montanum]|uniref:Phosphonate C-P lyase system protein PhnG n=1 Tax=Fibrisoma montanum TaxID=2305895 RepID=A0A418MAH7_9BACT|nr:phosphonate C-P lyase system protein PhnG [Fibrisoma montanum]RIV23382.1 phosphonate C-P lyase system protein PhnG [Fibrisoma montanum]